jgi:tripartite-type tricarboxylate transporter receptor subunit TctC
MKMIIVLKSTMVAVAVALLGSMMVALPVLAQERYPSRQIEMVIPFPAGGSTDISGRMFANELSKILKVAVVPVNKVGSSGTIAGTYVNKAKKDGYTLLAGSQGWFFGSIIYEKEIVYDPLKDFIHIANFHVVPHALCVRKDSPLKTLEDFIGAARKNPGAISVGTPGLGGDSYFNLQVLLKAAGVQIKHVPYKGIGEVPPALLGGHIQVGIGPASPWIPFVKSGDVRTLGITSRMKDIPEAPSFQERGFKGRYFDNWAGVSSPAGVPQNVIDALVDACDKMLKSKEFLEGTEKTGCVIRYIKRAEFQKHLEEDRKVVDAMARELGIKK